MFEFEIIQEFILIQFLYQVKLWKWIQHSKIKLLYIYSIV